MDVTARVQVPEWMDEPGVEPRAHRCALRGLRRINAFSRTSPALWGALQRAARRRGLRALRVLDVATGGGDVARSLCRRGCAAGYDVRVDGCDVSPTAVAHAGAGPSLGGRVRFFVHDALRDPLPTGYDFVVATLFLHHLAEGDAVRLLRAMGAAARHGVLVDDLHRSPTHYWLAVGACRVLSRSPIVHFDGPASVRSAFTADEALGLARRAGAEGATVRRRWPQRFLLAWETPCV